MFLFSSCLNRVQRISLAGYRLMEMSSSESPYFLSKLGGNKEECQTTSSKSDSYQKSGTCSTRSSQRIQSANKVKSDEITLTGGQKARKVRKVVAISEDRQEMKWAPENWESVVDNIRKMRINRDAPVDLMGAEQCADEATTPEVKLNF